MKLLNICLFGPPGAGKGTQSKYLLEKYNLTYVSTGDILRKEIVEATELGLNAKTYMDKGMLVPDEVIVQIIERTILMTKDTNGFLFDGFPRTVIQAYILEGLMLKLRTSLSGMLSIEVPKDELLKRMVERAKKDNRVDDADTDVINYRLQEYENKTLPVASFFKDQNKYCTIDGTGTVEDVMHRIFKSVQFSLKNRWVNIVLSGPPGAGKGTQSKLLADKFNLVHIATGDMIRKAINEKSEIGVIASQYIDVGDMVPDELVVKLIECKIKTNKHAKGFLFDGFPINLVQSYILDGLLGKLSSEITSMIYLDVPTLTSIRRLTSRWDTEERRSYDSNIEIIVKRLEKYEFSRKVVNKYYDSQNKLFIIDGIPEKEFVYNNLSKLIKETFMKVH